MKYYLYLILTLRKENKPKMTVMFTDRAGLCDLHRLSFIANIDIVDDMVS